MRGLASDDLLNVREEPSPLGKTLGRLPNGALVRIDECSDVSGYEWCRVDALDIADVSGWTPARYLQSLAEFNAEMEQLANSPADSGTEPISSNMAGDEEGPVDVPIPKAAPRDEMAADVAIDNPAEVAIVPPAGSGGRQVEAARPAADENANQRSDASMEVQANLPAASAIPKRTTSKDASLQEDSRDGNQAGEAAARRQARVRVRQTSDILPPGLEARFAGAEPASVAKVSEPPAEPEEVSAEIPTTTASTRSDRAGIAGEVPCARFFGHPMERCVAMVARTGERNAKVTIVWPDGGSRQIVFRDGLPRSSNSDEALRFTREGELNLIRIGAAERFEILDALAFED